MVLKFVSKNVINANLLLVVVFLGPENLFIKDVKDRIRLENIVDFGIFKYELVYLLAGNHDILVRVNYLDGDLFDY